MNLHAGEASAEDAFRRTLAPLLQGRAWMRLVAALCIMAGVAAALTVIGVIVAWLPIWMGVLLLQSAALAENAQRSGDPGKLAESLTRLQRFLALLGVAGLLLILLFIMGLLGLISLGMLGSVTGTGSPF